MQKPVWEGWQLCNPSIPWASDFSTPWLRCREIVLIRCLQTSSFWYASCWR